MKLPARNAVKVENSIVTRKELNLFNPALWQLFRLGDYLGAGQLEICRPFWLCHNLGTQGCSGWKGCHTWVCGVWSGEEAPGDWPHPLISGPPFHGSQPGLALVTLHLKWVTLARRQERGGHWGGGQFASGSSWTWILCSPDLCALRTPEIWK